MQGTIKILTSEYNHFIEMLQRINGSGKLLNPVLLISSLEEDGNTTIIIEFSDPGDMFHLGILFGSIKPIKILNRQTIETPGGNRSQSSFHISFT